MKLKIKPHTPKRQQAQTAPKTIRRVQNHVVKEETIEAPVTCYIALRNLGKYKTGDIIPNDEITIEMRKNKYVKQVELLVDDTSTVETTVEN